MKFIIKLSFLLVCAVFSSNGADCFAQTAQIPIQLEFSEPEIVQKQQLADSLSKNWEAASTRQALEIYLETSDLWKRLQNKEKSGECLLKAARLKMTLNDTNEAFVLLENSLSGWLKTDVSPVKAETLALMTQIALELGKIRKAEKFYQNAIAVAAQTNNPEANANAFFSAAEFFYFKREISQSIIFYQKSLDLFRIAGNRSSEAQTLVALSHAEMARNDALSGLTRAQEALLIYQELGNKRGQAFANIAAGHMQTTINESQAAVNSYFAAEQLFPNDMDSIEKAMLFNGMGAVYEDYRYWQRSLSYRQKAFAIYEGIDYGYGKVATLPSLVKLAYLNGDLPAAIEYFNQGERLAKTLGDEVHLALLWKEMGNIQLSSGANADALKYHQRALKLIRKNNLKKEEALIYNHFGRNYEQQGKIDFARDYYLRAIKIFRAVKGRFSEAETLFNLARLDAAQNRTESALRLIEESLDLTESLRGEIANSRMKRVYLSQVYERYEFDMELLMKMHERFPNKGYDARALQTGERMRARTLLENLRLSGVNLTEGSDSELVKREKEIRVKINSAADALTNLLSRDADRRQTAQLNCEIEELLGKYEEIQATLKAQNPRYAALSQPPNFDVAKFQSEILDDDTVLLEFSLGKERSFLWFAGRRELMTVALPPRFELENRVRKLLQLLTDRQIHGDESIGNYQGRIIEADAEYNFQAQELSNILLNPIAEKLRGKRLIIVADGILHYLPLTALPSPSKFTDVAPHTPLVVHNEIIYQPSAAVISNVEELAVPSKADAKTVLIFADPIFSEQDERIAARQRNSNANGWLSAIWSLFDNTVEASGFTEPPFREGFARLPASQTEAAEISKIAGFSRSKIVQGAAANREKVFSAEMLDYQILHFATHSIINEEKPELSGIALSSFDANGQPLDGLLRLHEVYNLKLSADLVVLSACDSGIGSEVRGEGIVSLTRGFFQAGSRSIVASAWKVEDAATADLMKIFYRILLNENVTPALALRRAQIEMSQNPRWRSPFYWAAFTAQGEYRRPFKPAV